MPTVMDRSLISNPKSTLMPLQWKICFLWMTDELHWSWADSSQPQVSHCLIQWATRSVTNSSREPHAMNDSGKSSGHLWIFEWMWRFYNLLVEGLKAFSKYKTLVLLTLCDRFDSPRGGGISKLLTSNRSGAEERGANACPQIWRARSFFQSNCVFNPP